MYQQSCARLILTVGLVGGFPAALIAQPPPLPFAPATNQAPPLPYNQTPLPTLNPAIAPAVNPSAALAGMPAPVLPAAPGYAVPSLPAAPDAQVPWTLDRLERLAEQVNPILPRDRNTIEANRGSAQQAGIWTNPRFDTNNPQVFQGRSTTLNVGFQMEIPVMGKKRLDQAAANQVVRQAEITLEADRFTMLTSLRQQFYTVLVDQRRVQILEEMVGVLKDSYETGVKRKKAGDASQADVLVLLLDYQRAQANLRNARLVLDSDRRQIGDLVGIPGLVTRDVAGQLSGTFPNYTYEMLDRYVTQGHTSVRTALAVIEQYRYLLRRAEVEPYPNPYMGPAHQYGLVPGADQFWFNIQFNIPVWDRNQGNIRAARGNLAAAQDNLRTIQVSLLNQAHNLMGPYLGAVALVRQFETALLPNTRETVRLAREGYAKGLTDFATFLAVQRNLVQVNSDYLDALQNLWNTAAQIGGLLQLEHFP